ncbi:PucR family transcriptional regulator [Pseudonocardia spirodelae]|uniref:PucR family transcriptional regulator n=1 Tax=Pseudonocardia spirodelae TaxID=3133431 RepID=A0ABU8T892_9PSEU
MHPTIADVLARPEVRAGAPAVRAGRRALDTPVRWAHVSEVADPAGTLPPGSLVLSVGMAAADPTTDPQRYVAALRGAGAVGLVVEIGRLPALPAGLVQAARAAGFVLVELRRAVRFAEIVAGVLEDVVAARRADGAGAAHAAALLTGLALHRAAPQQVLEEAAGLLGAPLVCEDLAHRVLLDAGGPDLRDWPARSRLAGPAGPEGWVTAPVGRPGRRWGRLVLPSRPPAADRAAALLDRAADALSLLDADPVALLHDARDAVVAGLLAAPPGPGGAAAVRAHAVGVPAGPDLVVLAVRGGPAATGLRAAVDDALTGFAGAVVAAGADGVLALVPGPVPPDLPAAVAARLPGGTAVAAAGPERDAEPPALLRRAVADVAAHARTGGTGAVRTPALRGLVHALRDDPRLLGFTGRVLGPVLALPGPARAEALATLEALTATGGVVAEAARRLGVGRPAAYARLRRLGVLLGADPTDPEVRTALHLALLAARSSGRDERSMGHRTP